MDIDWAAPAAWANRAPHFRALVDRGRPFVQVELVPSTIDHGWPRLRDLWIALPRHGNLLDAIEPIDVDDAANRVGVLVRYAALDWWKPVLALDSDYSERQAAAFGAQLADLFEMILDHVEGPDRALFLSPFAHIDLDGELRVGFEGGAKLRPPEPKLDERAFVFVVGRLWLSMLETLPQVGVGKIIRRCIDVSPRARFASLAKLKAACFDLSAPRGLRSGERLDAWYAIEEAIGWRARGDREAAYRRFQAALRYRSYRSIAHWGATDTAAPVFIGPLRPPPPPRPAIDSPPPREPPPAPPPPPTPARVSYLEGRALFLQRKLHEAHACFSSAILLDPLMIEAQLLRREVDRALARVRATTGAPTSQPIDVPPSLREVRDLVLAGRIREAIAILATDRYADNADAALFRARLLALDGQYDLATSAFAAITSGPHAGEARLGLARVTIDRGKPAAALSLLDELVLTRPRDLGVLEARARCLELLGRSAEAAEAMKTFIAAVELASDVRLSRDP